MYTMYYVKQDVADDGSMGEDDTWSVYREDYESIDSPEPIEGSTVLVSGNHIFIEADRIAQVSQRMSYSENRRANHGA